MVSKKNKKKKNKINRIKNLLNKKYTRNNTGKQKQTKITHKNDRYHE